MIVPSIANANLYRSAFSQHLKFELAHILHAKGCIPEHAGDVADGVAAAVAEQWADQALPTDFISLMVSKALCVAGEPEAAACWLENHFGGRMESDAAMQLATNRNMSLPTLELVSRGLLRASRWIANPAGVTWILDLGLVRQERGPLLELACFQTLRNLVETVAEVWDASNGAGTLGICGLAPHIQEMLGRDSDRDVRRLSKELVQFCEQILAMTGPQRHWQHTPRVMMLDAQP